VAGRQTARHPVLLSSAKSAPPLRPVYRFCQSPSKTRWIFRHAACFLFFLADPVFLGDAFASVGARAYSPVPAVAGVLALLKAWSLARASGFALVPRQAFWLGTALVVLHQIPTLDVLSAPSEGSSPWPQAVSWLLAGLSVPLYRSGRLGRAAIAALGVHFTASLIVASLPFQLELLSGPLAASAALLPWPGFGWMPLPLSLYCSPSVPASRGRPARWRGWECSWSAPPFSSSASASGAASGLRPGRRCSHEPGVGRSEPIC